MIVLAAALVVVAVVGGIVAYRAGLRRGGEVGRIADDPEPAASATEAAPLPVEAAVGELLDPTDPVEGGPEPDDIDDTAPDVDLGAVLRAAVNELEIGVVVSDADGDVVYRNQTAAALGGTHVGVIVDEHLEHLLGAARRGKRTSELIDLHGPPQMWLALEAEPMPGDAAVATIQDVSERVRIDTMRTDFVANISHELRTPVGAIAVLAETLAEEDDIEVVHRIVERLVAEAHRAVQTIDDLLELSSIESARAGDDLVDLRDVVQAAISRGRVADAGSGIEVGAVKYSEDGGVVQVRTRLDDHNVEVMVADQGVGIPKRDLDRVFERFYRVDKARSRGTGGTGLGLAIVRHVATNHGGEVLVSSSEGEGSTFVLRLPASLVAETQCAAESDGDADDDRSSDSSQKENTS
jgi:two-component system sensor histidine kinase SenX3